VTLPAAVSKMRWVLPREPCDSPFTPPAHLDPGDIVWFDYEMMPGLVVSIVGARNNHEFNITLVTSERATHKVLVHYTYEGLRRISKW
jgi:hypothetical protein